MKPQVVRAKLMVVGNNVAWEGSDKRSIRLVAIYDPDPDSENRAFWEATPAANFTMDIVNPETAAFFEPNKFYYVDFTPAVVDSSE